MSAISESRDVTSRSLDHSRFHLVTATLTIAAVLLAYMTFFGKPDATSIAVSESRVSELVLLAGAAIGGFVMWSRSGVRPPVGASNHLIVVVTGFSVWAMATSLEGPLFVIGVIKSLELLVICFVSLQIAVAANTSGRLGGVDLAGAVLAGVVVVVIFLVCTNVVTVGRPFPLETMNDWFSTNVRQRLMLGTTNPLMSALVLSLGLLSAYHTKVLSWPVKIPLILTLGGMLYLCDARGVWAGCLAGLAVSVVWKIPSSPYKLLWCILAACTAAIAFAWYVSANNLDEMILNLEGQDVFTLNSRTALWSYMLSRIHNYPIAGVGFYSTRLYILDAFPFAGHAHNSAIEVLFSTGLIGGVFLFAFHALWAYAVFTAGNGLLIGITPIVLIESNLNPVVLNPSPGMFLLLVVLLNALITGSHRQLSSGRTQRAPKSGAAPTGDNLNGSSCAF
jgi:hypothetical protein